MDLAVSEFRLGERRYFTGIVRDITERKRAEEEVHRLNEELQRRLDELQTVLKVLPVGLAIAHDSACRRMTLNPYMSDLLGVPMGANASLSAPPDERPTCYTNYQDGKEVPPDELPMQVACTGIEVRDFEVDLVRVGRDSLKLLCYARPLHDGDSRVRGSVGAFLDITQLKRVEQALREADHRKDDFLATLAHELRNPLAPIRNALELLRKGNGDATLIEEARSVMVRQVGQMVRLVDDLLDVSRISHGKMQLRQRRVELGEVLGNAIETSRPLVEAVGHELTVASPPVPIYLEADPVRLAQVFSNLLNNAARYTDTNGRIRLSVERQGSDVLVSVKDNGIGIAAEMLPRIFQMFAQATPALERSQSGLGIGLSLVKGVVELHGGRVEAHSDGPGNGSEFVVRLPIIVEKQVQETQSHGDNDVPLSVAKRRVLIVDDLKDNANSLAMLLKIMGHDVHTAYDGEDAITEAEKFKPEVILLDIGMPKLNGYEACRRIREESWGKDIFLIALTGWGQEDDRRRTEEAGFNRHMVKPVDTRELMKVLVGLQATAE